MTWFGIAAMWLENPTILFWVLFSISTFITMVHTIDEIISPGGPIWDYLFVNILGLKPSEIFVAAYFVFQSTVLFFSWQAFSLGGFWIISFVIVRLGDFGFTHRLLLYKNPVNPGKNTSLLLLSEPLYFGLLFFLG